MSNRAIDPAGLQAMLDASARIGATANGGLRRLTLTPEDKAARDLFMFRPVRFALRAADNATASRSLSLASPPARSRGDRAGSSPHSPCGRARAAVTRAPRGR